MLGEALTCWQTKLEDMLGACRYDGYRPDAAASSSVSSHTWVAKVSILGHMCLVSGRRFVEIASMSANLVWKHGKNLKKDTCDGR